MGTGIPGVCAEHSITGVAVVPIAEVVGATVYTVGVESTGVVKGIDFVSIFESQE